MYLYYQIDKKSHLLNKYYLLMYLLNVFMIFSSWCNACQSCYNGHPNYCQNGGLRSTIGIFLNGGFAKFCIVPLNLVNKLPNEVSMEQGNVFFLLHLFLSFITTFSANSFGLFYRSTLRAIVMHFTWLGSSSNG